MKYGYVRVSSRDQNPERQIAALIAVGIERSNLYIDYLSGKDFRRPAYCKLLKKVRRGDLLTIKSIDRLGRNYGEILEQWRILTVEKQIHIEVLDFSLLNTTTPMEGLTGQFIADLVLQILAYVAQTEREFIRRRQMEGIALAKERGVKFGRMKASVPKEFETYYRKWRLQEISSRQAAKELGISHSTFYRRSRELSNQDLE